MPILSNNTSGINKRPSKETILQFGEGVFLRGFIDTFIDQANEEGHMDAGVLVVQPKGFHKVIFEHMNNQDCLYTMILRGVEKGEAVNRSRVITSLTRCLNPEHDFGAYIKNIENPDLQVIISNTTEAGIAYAPSKLEDMPPASFPAKVTQFLFRRYQFFDGAANKGFVFIPCELIDDNGKKLKELVLRYASEWNLPAEFATWVEAHNTFCSTLVDRIVAGYPGEEAPALWDKLGYEDNLLDTAEVFHFFSIEAPADRIGKVQAIFPIHKISNNIIWTDDIGPYKARKVRLLNGGHTMSVLAAYLAGHEIVGEMMADTAFLNLLKTGMYDEIIPTLDLPKQDLLDFADSVVDRFKNPFIKHQLLSIAMNSISKWRVRVMPSLLAYVERQGELPKMLTFSLAALIAFCGTDNINDDQDIMDYFATKPSAADVLANTKLWEQDLTQVAGLLTAVETHLAAIDAKGMKAVMATL